MGKRSKSESMPLVESPPSKKKATAHDVDGDDDNNDANNNNSQVDMSTTSSSQVDLGYSEKLAFASPIASPIASKKLTKKLLKLIKKACKHKNHLRSGLRDVQTRIRKGERGICVFAADVTPIDVMCHLPAVCEDKEIAYAFVPMRKDIAEAMGVRRPTLMALVVGPLQDEAFISYKELYDECLQAIKSLE